MPAARNMRAMSRSPLPCAPRLLQVTWYGRWRSVARGGRPILGSQDMARVAQVVMRAHGITGQPSLRCAQSSRGGSRTRPTSASSPRPPPGWLN